MTSEDSTQAGTGGNILPLLISIVVALVIGVCIGYALCYFGRVRKLEAHLDARERALRDWERLTRIEREQVADVKSMSIQETMKYLAKLDEASTRFARLEQEIFDLEREMLSPGTTFIVIAAIAVLGSLALMVLLMRDANQKAAHTIENLMNVSASRLRDVLGPPQREVVVAVPMDGARLDRQIPQHRTSLLSGPAARMTGRIREYDEEKEAGHISPDSGEEDIPFRLTDVVSGAERDLTAGRRVAYRVVEGAKGPEAVEVKPMRSSQ